MTKFAATIFVEGDSDQRFLCDFVKYKFDYDLDVAREIQIVKGKNNLSAFQNNFIQSSEQGFTNLVIFDANGSLQQSTVELNNKKEALGVEFHLFFFPNNHDDGDLEKLLENIIVEENRVIFGCFDSFTDCLNKIEGVELNIPNRKIKIYSYSNLFFKEGHHSKRDYLDKELWNLDSDYLQNLTQFLAPYFQEQ